MPIELNCTGCGRQLRVPDAHAGKQARCPVCGTICLIPSSGSSGEPNPLAPLPSQIPSFTPQPFNSTTSQNPFSDNVAPPTQSPFGLDNPYATPNHTGNLFRGRPHRGAVVLTFGILGIFCCIFFGIAAWIMGHEDLKAIRAGQMDPSGQALTQAGMIVGIISCVIKGLWWCFVLLANMIG